MRRSAAAVASWLAACSASACGSESPTPTKVEAPASRLGADAPETRDTPFSNPSTEPPPPRSEPQLEPAALEAVLAKARPLVESDEHTRALIELRRCANKVPKNGECEALMASVLLEHRLQKAHALYYLEQSVDGDDPTITTDRLRILAKLAIDNSRFAEARRAIEIVRDRGEANADDYATLARALQVDTATLGEATEALAKAIDIDPSRHDLVRDRAILLAQLGDREQALALLKTYRTTLADDARETKTIDDRIATLERELAPKKKSP